MATLLIQRVFKKKINIKRARKLRKEEIEKRKKLKLN
jgi:hypothetical protein